MIDKIKALMEQAARLEAEGATARSAGDEAAAEASFRAGLGLATDAKKKAARDSAHSDRLEILRIGARLALHCGEAAQARELIEEARAISPSFLDADDWSQLRDIALWPDSWLIAAIRQEPPDVGALDALVERHWKKLFGRCQLLASNQGNAADMAQEAWRRILRSRRNLKPGGNFGAYITTIATNLWRDTMRVGQRAGAMAQHRLASLDETLSGESDDNGTLIDIVADPKSLQEPERRQLALDLDHALGQLPPLLRDVLVARFLTGESCAEIGRRYGRTEQTISGWVRTAVQQMKLHLGDPNPTGS
jgi:RNA polymerase sigma factor (sigma-70 family)